MTHDTPPKRIWADPPETFDGMDVWRSEPGGKGIPYILASEAEAMVAAALREAAREVDLRYAEGAMGNPGHYIAPLIPQPASAALDKLIAEAVKAERDALEVQYDELYADALADAKSDSREFEGELWKAIRSILDDLDYDWSGDAQEDGVSADEAAQFIRDALDCNTLRAQLAEVQKREAGYQEALIWCSGSDDFQADGKARAGWLKLCAPLIDRAALSAAPTGEESNG